MNELPIRPPQTPPQTLLEPAPQTLASENSENSDRVRLLKERERRIANAKPPQSKRQSWFKQWLSF